MNGVAGSYTETSTDYYLTGNVAKVHDALGRETSFFYDDSFATYADDASNTETIYTPATKTYAYPTQIQDPALNSSSLKYWYETGAPTKTIDPKGAAAISIYEPVHGRLLKAKNLVNNASTRYVYATDHNSAQALTTVNSLTEETSTISVFDGIGRTRVSVADHPGSVGGLRGSYQVYDILGRVSEWSNPTEIYGGANCGQAGQTACWLPYGDDASGYKYSTQTFDWKSRPLVTTNQDFSTRQIAYTGCGCAGGQVTTLTDEMGRQQKVYADFLGRTFKSEIWNGAAVYSTNTTTFNVRDQATQSSLIAGTNGASQTKTAQYDGYGRLWKSKAPDETTDTTYEYFNDDQIMKVTDARNAITNYSYNNTRGLLSDISYIASPSVVATPSVSFQYDVIGHIKQMTDGPGYINYNYDQQSLLTSEVRYFSALNKSYTLGYSYNLAGKLKTFVSPFNHTVTYDYDKIGRLTGVSDLPVGGNSNVWSNQIKYRAWGSLKTMNYGNGMMQARQYNSRQNITNFLISGSTPNSQYGGSTDAMKLQYWYYPDGSPKLVEDQLDVRFTRGWQYDQAGRLSVGWTGSEAVSWFNGQTPGETPTGPYKQTYSYNVWTEMTGRYARFWSKTENFTATYNDARRSDWTYDAAGNVTTDGVDTYSFDVAGRNIRVKNLLGPQEALQSFDGTGAKVLRSELDMAQYPGNYVYATKYYLRSTPLSGQVIAELWQDGSLLNEEFEIGARDRIIRDVNGNYFWRHKKPHTGSEGSSNSTHNFTAGAEFDTAAVNVGQSEPLPLPANYEPDLTMYIGDVVGDPNAPKCELDGLPEKCFNALRLVGIDAATIDPRRTSSSAAHQLGLQETWVREDTANPLAPPTFTGTGSDGLDEYTVQAPTESWSLGYELGTPQQQPSPTPSPHPVPQAQKKANENGVCPT